jgi:hypothetical protein
MVEAQNQEGWVYVVVSDPEKDENFLGLYDKEKNINYIPAFESKEAANDCFLSLPREKGRKYEIQAIHIEELTQDAANGGFVVALVDGDGNIK